MPGVVWPTAACAVPGVVWPKAACAVLSLELSGLQQLVLSLELSGLQQLVLTRACLQEPVLHLCVSVCKSVFAAPIDVSV